MAFDRSVFMKAYLADPVHLAKHKVACAESVCKAGAGMSERMKRLWADPEWRAGVLERRKEARRTPEARAKRSEIAKRLWADPEYRDKNLKSRTKTASAEKPKTVKGSGGGRKGRPRGIKGNGKGSLGDLARRAKSSARLKALWTTPEYRTKMTDLINSLKPVTGERTRGWWKDPEYRGKELAHLQSSEFKEAASYRGKILAHVQSKEFRADASRRMFERWAKDPNGISIRGSAGFRPNKLEAAVQTYLDEHFPGEWKYNQGEFVIAGKVPDFVNVNGVKAVLEAFGDFWHKGQDSKERQDVFRSVGYTCYVVWEKDFRKDPSILSQILESARRG